MPYIDPFSWYHYGIAEDLQKWGTAYRNKGGDYMSDDTKSENSESSDRKVSESCCYIVDPCGCRVVDPCGCYVDPCGCYVDPCCC